MLSKIQIFLSVYHQFKNLIIFIMPIKILQTQNHLLFMDVTSSRYFIGQLGHFRIS